MNPQEQAELVKIKKQFHDMQLLNRELVTIYEQYSDDTIGIIDANGLIEFTGTSFAKLCGVSVSDLIGKSVFDLEKQRVFYPSVFAKVLKSKQPELIFQYTQTGNQRICIGTPIFDDTGKIVKVISITKGYLKEVKIGEMLPESFCNSFSTAEQRSIETVFSTCSNVMLRILRLAKMVAATDVTILIHGETGTGKEVLAKFIHEYSPRKTKPFIKINCGAISDSLFESELFGYEAGTFTGANKDGKIGLLEAANTGTLFFDEISELPYNQQVKLLQVLQEKSFFRVGGTEKITLNIRIIAASNKDLIKQIAKKRFREDLYYRLNIIPLQLPPLRERPEDIPLLIRHFTKKFSQRFGHQLELSPIAFNAMCLHEWPGNVRELENTIERLFITATDHFVDIEDLPFMVTANTLSETDALVLKKTIPLAAAIEEVEKQLITRALHEQKNAKKAAEVLEIDPSTISRKMKYYRIK